MVDIAVLKMEPIVKDETNNKKLARDEGGVILYGLGKRLAMMSIGIHLKVILASLNPKILKYHIK